MAQSLKGAAEKVREHRRRIELDPELYEGDIDVVLWIIDDFRQRDFSPSEMARIVDVDLLVVRHLLIELADGGHIKCGGNGSRRRFWSRLR